MTVVYRCIFQENAQLQHNADVLTEKQDNPGGPGRPKRAIERNNMAAIGCVVTLESWEAVIRKTLSDALSRDPRAREWLSLRDRKRPTGKA